MNRTQTRLLVILLSVVAIIAAVGALIAMNNSSGGGTEQTVTSSPTTDSDKSTDDPGPADTEPADSGTAESELVDPDDDSLGGPDNDLIAGDEPGASRAGLQSWCTSVEHSPPAGLGDWALSGVYLSGDIFSAGYQSIELQGPTLNQGELLIIPIDGTRYDGVIGIDTFGDHEIQMISLVDPVGDLPRLDLLSTLELGPGALLPVGPGEGPLFGQDCFEFSIEDLDVQGSAGVSDGLAPDAPEALGVVQFLDAFVAAHRTGDTENLFNTLHPAVPERFGEETCREYIDRTVGSITAAEVVGVGDIGAFELDTPQGPIGFPSAIPVDIEFTTSDGTTSINAAHLPLHNGEVTWLTMCGVD